MTKKLPAEVVNPPNLFEFTPKEDKVNLGEYARQAYLEYAVSVVKGRSLPDICDGQKPVQRRILYSMLRMGLAFFGAAATQGARAVKSARVVGDVLGKFHPHGDKAAYDTMVRMAQDFSQRYPLVDGHGNFGSRDGDSAAAMRYTEARLAKISNLLLSEIDEGTVDFRANYDGSTEEPLLLPARLPFLLLNGASGIAVGLATEIPSHNLTEVAKACVALLKNPDLNEDTLFTLLPGPDFPGGGQIISKPSDIHKCYSTGRGSMKVRARFRVEPLSQGQWQWVVFELPPGVSTQKVLQEIDAITNPKSKFSTKSRDNEAQKLKTSLLQILSSVRDESSKESSVRLVFEPKSKNTPVGLLADLLLQTTSLEVSVAMNLTVINSLGNPVCLPLKEILQQWLAFRVATVIRRCTYFQQKYAQRLHILEGRLLVLLHLDEVIALIREQGDPKTQLMKRYHLSETQAEDILEIKLRQLAKLETLKLEKEQTSLSEDLIKLQHLLEQKELLHQSVIREIQQDSQQFGDARRTLIEAVAVDNKPQALVSMADENHTIVISHLGWVRCKVGLQGIPPPQGQVTWEKTSQPDIHFKIGDRGYGVFHAHSQDLLVAFSTVGKVYSLPVHQLPPWRADGQPLTSWFEVEAGAQLTHFIVAAPDQAVVLATTSGYGFITQVAHLSTKTKGGKQFINLATGDQLCRPCLLKNSASTSLICLSDDAKILGISTAELKTLTNGGKGERLIKLATHEKLLGILAVDNSFTLSGLDKEGQTQEKTFVQSHIKDFMGTRGQTGKKTRLGFKIEWFWR
ncbi:MAG: DNA topoisomerase IV subunit A [Gammaproteobacteria bacterium]|nr:DNA topoisomerase IV subunit A [Gammaproteobacteria bacterium]